MSESNLDNDSTVEEHSQKEEMEFEEFIPAHIDRSKANQTVFDNAKKYLTNLYGGKRCSICEWMGIKPTDIHKDNIIESHHFFEWSHWNAVEMRKVEAILRTISPLIHGLYMMSVDEINSGKPLYSLWNESHFKNKPFDSLDDPRKQWFLCHAHHQQSNKTWTELGADHDFVGLHHAPAPLVFLYFVMMTGQYPLHHVEYKPDGKVNREV